MKKKYIVRLTETERRELEHIVHKGKASAQKRLHAQVLLKADVSELGDKWRDKQICEAFDVSPRTVERIREKLVEKGLEAALNRVPPSRVKSKTLDGENEAHLIALTCGEAPEGRNRWTLRLLASKMVELKYVESISYETIRQTLKKTN